MASGPVQPMSNIAQANLRGMRDEILGWNPDYPPHLADTSVNNKLREVLDRRMWSGLLVRDQLVIPDATTAGTAAVTRDSAVVVGTLTGWPVSDKVNTTLVTAVPAENLNIPLEVSLGTMTSVVVGDWLTIAANLASEEQVLVVATTATSIKAIFTIVHLAGVGVTRSSLHRQQFRVGNYSPWYSIKGVSSATRLILDMPFGGATDAAASYSAFQGYVTFGQNVKMVYSVMNMNSNWRIRLHMPQEAVAHDFQRSAAGPPYYLLDYVPDEVGRPRYELYPHPTSAQVLPYIVYRQVPNMSDDDDTPPPFVRSDVLVKGALADALRWRGRTNRFYDPQTAMQKLVEFEKGVIEMAMADDSVYLTNFTWDHVPYGGAGGEWYQSHDADYG